jgi:hypothetical protein
MAWYPRAMDWFARSSPHAIWQVVIFFQPWAWTFSASWCVLLASIAWLLVRFKPRHANLMLVAFAMSQISQGLPVLGRSFGDWLHAPSNPIWISNLVIYALFMFLACPLSIVAGGRMAGRRRLTDLREMHGQ